MKLRRKPSQFVRENSEPYLLEVITYRFRGHSMGDPERYRKAEEVKKWEESDPIGIFRKQLLEKKTASAKALDEIEAAAEEEVARGGGVRGGFPGPRWKTGQNIYRKLMLCAKIRVRGIIQPRLAE